MTRAGDREPLSVIVLNDFAERFAGTDQVALAEAAGLARRGHRVTLVAGSGEPDRELVDAGVEVRLTGQPSTLEDPNRVSAAGRGIWNLAAASLVRELAGRAGGGSAVIHLHGFTKVLSASAIRAAARSGLPLLATLHDYFVACPNGGFFNYRTNRICPLEPMSARCIATNCDARAYSHKLWRVARSAVQRGPGAMPAGVSEFIVPSAPASEIVRRHLPAGSQIHVLPNPVAADRRPAADVAGNDAFVFVGRLQRDKGAMLFAEAARRARVRAVFVGAGEEEAAIRRANPGAELTGRLAPERVREVVRGARALVNPSMVYETQGLTIAEAAADGVPAIVSDVSLAREAVEDGVTGLWFRGGDASDLERQLTAISGDPALAGRLGGAAHDRFWAAPPDLAGHLDRLESIYRAALS